MNAKQTNKKVEEKQKTATKQRNKSSGNQEIIKKTSYQTK